MVTLNTCGQRNFFKTTIAISPAWQIQIVYFGAFKRTKTIFRTCSRIVELRITQFCAIKGTEVHL